MLHFDEAAVSRNCIAVICPPHGYEYAHSHRSVRHLADALARHGIQALRFDYHGTGDSAGSDLDENRFQRWLRDVKLAVSEATRLGGSAAVCLIGIRLGATLAALAATEVEVDSLVLWNTCTSGRRYVREQQAVAAQATQAAPERAPDAPLESAGFMLSAQTMDSLKAVDLLKTPSRARRGVLLIERDDLGEDTALRDHFTAQGVAVETIACPGYNDMMAEPVRTQVPQVAIDETVSWLLANSEPSTHQKPFADDQALGNNAPFALSLSKGSSQATGLRQAQPERNEVVQPERDELVFGPAMRLAFTGTDGVHAELIETACRFGSENHLFGIHTRPATPHPELPTVVLFSAGVVHRMGPNRLYTLIARNLAALGFPCLRCDIEGIGDSVRRAPGRENHPYPAAAIGDAEQAFDFLQQRFGVQSFIAMGLCSGAYTSFLAGVSNSAYPLREIMLINPLTFQWTEGDTLDTDHFRQVAHYRGSMRSGSSWKKLLRGQVNVPKVARLVMAHLAKQVQSRVQALVERVHPQSGSLLATRLRSLYARGRHVAVFIAEGDPGWDMLTAGARQAASEGLKRGDLSVGFIANADHTFSGEAARRRLMASLREHLKSQYMP